MSRLFFVLLLGCSLGAWAQDSSTPASSSPSSASSPSSSSAAQDSKAKPRTPSLDPPRSDRVNADDLSNGEGESSSKDTQIDLSAPADDTKKHPQSSEALRDEEGSSGDIAEFHPWDPHRAAKNVEVGDYYFKQKNYVAAESRYREALLYKDNDAVATFRLAVCLEKMNLLASALEQYENYLKILPRGPEAATANKAISRLKGTATSAKSIK